MRLTSGNTTGNTSTNEGIYKISNALTYVLMDMVRNLPYKYVCR